jgi:hypothetical protein
MTETAEERALAAYDRYAEDGDPACLAVVAAEWERAVAEATDPAHAADYERFAATFRAYHLLETGEADEGAVRRVSAALRAAGERLADDDPERPGLAVTLARLRLLAYHVAGRPADLDAAITTLTSVAAADVDEADRAAALGCLVDAYGARHAVSQAGSDLDGRIRALRELHRMPGAGGVPPGLVAGELGLALGHRAGDPEEIRALLAEAEADLDREHSLRPAVRRALGLQLWLGAVQGGSRPDADAALPLLMEVLAAGPDTQVALAVAQLLIRRALPEGVTAATSPAELARLVRGNALAAGREQAAEAVPLLAAVLSDPAIDDEVRAYASGQIAAAMLFCDLDRLSTDVLAEAAGHLDRAYASLPGQVEVVVQLGVLRAELARRRGNPEADVRVAVDLLSRAERLVPAGHPMRTTVLISLAYALVPQAARTQARDDVLRTVQVLEDAARAVEPDDPVRPDLLGQLGIVLTVALAHGPVEGGLDRIIGLLRAALAAPPAGPRRQGEFRSGPRRQAEFRSALADALSGRYLETGDDRDARESAASYRAAESLLAAADPFRVPVRLGLATLLWSRYDRRRDLRDLDESVTMLTELAVAVADRPELDVSHALGTVQVLLGSALLQQADRAVDPALAAELADRAQRELTAGVTALPAAHVALPLGRGELALLRLLRAVREEDEPALRTAIDALVAAGQAVPAGHPHRAPLLARAGQALAVHAARIGDVAALDEGIRWTHDALSASGPENGPLLRVGLGQALLHRHRLLGRAADLDAAVEVLGDGWRLLAGEPGHPAAAMTAMTLARALRRRSGREDPADADRLVEEALRAYGRRVLLQTGAGRALALARGASEDTLWAARWHLADGRPEAAVAALEAGRGLVLHAVVATAGVADLLAERGHRELAERWRAEAGAEEAPAELRHHALAALDGSPPARRLFDPPSRAELAAGLAAVDADALVYLVPAPEPWDRYVDDGAPGSGGAALTVDRAGAVRLLELPDLHAGAGTPLGDDPEARLPIADPAALDRLVEWSWAVAAGPLLDRLRELSPDRTPRAILVPVGALGTVPWHAARRPGGTGAAAYACGQAVITYAASGRQLADLAGNPGLPPEAGTVLVANPDGSLPAAGICASALREQFYPDADYLGLPRTAAVGPGTAAEVLDRLPGGRRPAAVIEFGCHAVAGASPAESRLELAGDEQLSVATVLDRAAARPRGGLVVLSACSSDLTVRQYDEALSLSSAFLGAGATGVLATGWAIDDRYAALAMYHVHHLMAAGAAPADAVRGTQLWMLDPDRVAPPGLPPALAKYVPVPELAHPLTWAAYAFRGR